MPRFPLKFVTHPVRLRIIEVVRMLEEASTEQIGLQLDDIPRSSIYRQLKLMLDAGLIEIAHMRQVNGGEEKFYRLAVPLTTDNVDWSEWPRMSIEEKLQQFSILINIFMSTFPDYMETAPSFEQMSREVSTSSEFFYATVDELAEFFHALDRLLEQMKSKPAAQDRKLIKFSSFIHPVPLDRFSDLPARDGE